jgi:tetratricopeptide (TPR) repeat protein
MQSDFEETMMLLRFADSMLKTFEKIDGLDPAAATFLDDLAASFQRQSGVLALYTNRSSDSVYHLTRYKTLVENGRSFELLRADPRRAVALHDLGGASLQNGGATLAEGYFLSSSDVLLRYLPNATTNMITMSQINLGFCYWLQGNLDAAANKFAEALKAREDAYGEDDTASYG